MRILFVMLLIAAGNFITGCANEVKPPTCDVYVESGKINIVIDLPAEEMEYRSTNDLKVPGFSGLPRMVTIETEGTSVDYSQTGNSYTIAYKVTYEDGEITDYHISIKGNVYGDVEHTCTK
jgi:hypothetical protein